MKNNLKIIFISSFIFVVYNTIVASNENDTKTTICKISIDLPSQIDLKVYLASLERLIDFSSFNKKYMSVNLAIGLSVLNVNIRPFLRDGTLPISLQDRLNNLVMRNDELLHYYFNYKLPQTHKNNMVNALFNNETAWSKRILRMNLGLLKKTCSYIPYYPRWSQYLQAVDDIDNTTPNRDLSDMCLLSLANAEKNPRSSKIFSLRCQIPVKCYKAIIFGTNFGYGLTHRYLLLLLARLSQACAIFSFNQDDFIRKTLCETMYREAEFIASNDFKLADLMFEQMALCSLDGHAQFLRKSWLTHLLRYQTSWGCFNIILPTSPIEHFESLTSIFHSKNVRREILDDACNEHITSVAAGALGAAIRLILENY